MCHSCGAETILSGFDGLRQCCECGSLQLKSGRMSRTFAVGSNGRPGPQEVATAEMLDSGAVRQTSSLAGKLASRRMAQDARSDLALAAAKAAGVVSMGDKLPIMAGSSNTGYCIGDRVKCSVRVAGTSPGEGSDVGVVVGPGRVIGEIMIKLDCSGVEVSMKSCLMKIVKQKKPESNVECNVRRRCRVATHFCGR